MTIHWTGWPRAMRPAGTPTLSGANVNDNPQADQAALRDRIRHTLCQANGFGFAWGTDMLEPDEYGEVADAVLAVLPAVPVPPATHATDRAAVYREAADAIDRKDAEQGYPEDGAGWATAELRRMADEAQQQAPWSSDGARIGRVLIWSHAEIGHGDFGRGYQAAQEEARSILTRPLLGSAEARQQPECSASISGSCLAEGQSETACDTDDAECVHGGQPASGPGRVADEEQPETDEQRADREETERDHASGNHEYCGVTCEAEFPTAMLRNGILAKGYPGTAGILDELLRRARAGRQL